MAAGRASRGSGNGSHAVKSPASAANRKPGVEREIERAAEAAGQEAKRQAGNVDPEMATA